MGAEFSSQCDLRLASDQARFAWNFVHRGLVPDTGAGTWLLPRIIGIQPALKLLYTGEMIGADEALRLGYVLDVVASDDLLPRAMELANTIAAGSPHSLGLIKSLVHEGSPRRSASTCSDTPRPLRPVSRVTITARASRRSSSAVPPSSPAADHQGTAATSEPPEYRLLAHRSTVEPACDERAAQIAAFRPSKGGLDGVVRHR